MNDPFRSTSDFRNSPDLSYRSACPLEERLSAPLRACEALSGLRVREILSAIAISRLRSRVTSPIARFLDFLAGILAVRSCLEQAPVFFFGMYTPSVLVGEIDIAA